MAVDKKKDDSLFYQLMGNEGTGNPTMDKLLGALFAILGKFLDGKLGGASWLTDDDAADPKGKEKKSENTTSTTNNNSPANVNVAFDGVGNLFGKGGAFENFEVRRESSGDGRFGNYRSSTTHPALDISKDKNGSRFDLKALGTGVVVFVSKAGTAINTDPGGYGNYFINKYGSGKNAIYTMAAHMTSINVNVGDKLVADQVMGTTGKTGNANSSKITEHVHFTTWFDGGDGKLYAFDASKYSLQDISTKDDVRQQAKKEAEDLQKKRTGYVISAGDSMYDRISKFNNSNNTAVVATNAPSSPSGTSNSSGSKLDNLSMKDPFFAAINGDDSKDRNDGKYSITQQAISIEKNPKNGKVIVVGELVIRDENGKVMTFKGADGQMREARFTFRSGGFDRGYMPGLDGKIPDLTYKLDWDNMRTTNLKKGMTIAGQGGFFLPFINTRNLGGRGNFGIHPDGDSEEATKYAKQVKHDGTEDEGTQACDGVERAQAKDAQIALNIVKGKENRAVVVNTLPPKDSSMFLEDNVKKAPMNVPKPPAAGV